MIYYTSNGPLMSKEHFHNYLALRDTIDEQCSRLWEIHSSHMECKAGCSSCCQAFRLLPIEYHYIKKKLEGKSIAINNQASEKECSFLVHNKCTIYEHRPIICRTHGYPLSRLNEEVEAYEISFCPLNFKEFNFEDFNVENLYPEDQYNSKLFMLNKKFIADFDEEEYDSLEMVELNHLAKYVV